MRRDDVLKTLDEHRAEMEERFGIRSLAIFGSVARDEARPDSDVDVLVEFTGPPTFNQYMGLLEYLEDRLLSRVDLVTTTGLKPGVRPYVERELIRVA